MKKFIRLILKLPITPVLVLYLLASILFGYIALFFHWVYETDKINESIAREILNEDFSHLKKWFTRI